MLKMSFDMKRKGPQPAGLHRHVFNGQTMGTRYSTIIMSEKAQRDEELENALFAAVERVDKQMSTWKPDSDLMQLNRAKVGVWTTVPANLFKVLEEALAINRASSGLFDPSVGSIVDAWGFGATSRQPDVKSIREQLGQTRPPIHALLELDHQRQAVLKKAQVKLDLCGIAKGYGVDAMAEVLNAFDIKNGLVGIDGEMRAVGSKVSGVPWSVALEKPDYSKREAFGMVHLQDAAIATSGDYRHWVKVGSRTFSHTMDPRRNGPLQNNVASVSVIAEQCMTADAWATALMVMGAEAGLHVARAKGINALFLIRDGERLKQITAGPVFGATSSDEQADH